MTWLYVLLEPASPENRLGLLIAALRIVGILGFALLTGYFVIQDSYLEATISDATRSSCSGTSDVVTRLRHS
jgi:hypothetical protein